MRNVLGGGKPLHPSRWVNKSKKEIPLSLFSPLHLFHFPLNKSNTIASEHIARFSLLSLSLSLPSDLHHYLSSTPHRSLFHIQFHSLQHRTKRIPFNRFQLHSNQNKRKRFVRLSARRVNEGGKQKDREREKERKRCIPPPRTQTFCSNTKWRKKKPKFQWVTDFCKMNYAYKKQRKNIWHQNKPTFQHIQTTTLHFIHLSALFLSLPFSPLLFSFHKRGFSLLIPSLPPLPFLLFYPTPSPPPKTLHTPMKPHLFERWGLWRGTSWQLELWSRASISTDELPTPSKRSIKCWKVEDDDDGVSSEDDETRGAPDCPNGKEEEEDAFIEEEEEEETWLVEYRVDDPMVRSPCGPRIDEKVSEGDTSILTEVSVVEGLKEKEEEEEEGDDGEGAPPLCWEPPAEEKENEFSVDDILDDSADALPEFWLADVSCELPSVEEGDATGRLKLGAYGSPTKPLEEGVGKGGKGGQACFIASNRFAICFNSTSYESHSGAPGKAFFEVPK